MTLHTDLRVAPLFAENAPTALGVFGPRESVRFNGELIATVHNAEYAAVFAAAPAMVAALKAIATADLTRIDCATLCNMARAAIPNAEGR